MILINVINLTDKRVARLAASLTGCKLYNDSESEGSQKFETSLANTVTATRLVRFFRSRGYTVTSERYTH